MIELTQFELSSNRMDKHRAAAAICEG